MKKVFLSAVSSECGSARRAIAGDLRSRGLDVREQSDFRQEATADTLLRKLHDYIEDCWAVVCIVGKRSGGFPPAAAVEPFKHLLPAGITRASYTQWELIFARHHRRRLSIYIADTKYAPDRDKAATDDEDPAVQAAFVAYLHSEGLDRDSFTTVDELRWKVLREDWPPVRHGKPNTLPYPSLGSLFKGREDFLATLRESLRRTAATGHATAITGRALHGLGGVGKTRLAVEYAWRHEPEYTALLFVSGDTPQTLEANIAQLVGPLAIELPADVEQEKAVAAALEWLGENPGWFLIIDNLDTPQAALAAQKLLARLKGGHVVLTSRIGQWHQYVEPLELDVLLPADATALLLEATRGSRRLLASDDADAAALAGELGSLALALEQAAAYVRKRRISLADYLAEWRSHKPEVQAWHDPLLMPYPRSVAVTWETTLRQLRPGEIALLRLLSFFAPDPIPLWVLEDRKATPIWQEAIDWVLAENADAGGTGGAPLPPQPPTADWRDALAQLADFSLARWTTQEQTVTVHRVLQEIIRTRLPAGRQKTWLTATLRLLFAVRPYPSNDVRTWPKWALFQPHVAYAVAEGDAMGIASPTAGLMNDFAQVLDAKALHAQAEPLMRRVVAIFEASLGSEHPNVATALSNLAALLKATNRLADAEPLMRRALAIDEASYGPQHPNVAIRLNNLAQLLQATNRLADAEPLMRRALTIDEASFGPQHPEVATDLNNLALLLQATNRLADAEPLMRRALAIDEASFGPQHPNVARDLNNLARLLQDTNRLADAEPLMRRAVAIFEASLGSEHPNTATALNNLAQLLKARS
jgi:tetratricopeptide (TPR) repeat protein